MQFEWTDTQDELYRTVKDFARAELNHDCRAPQGARVVRSRVARLRAHGLVGSERAHGRIGGGGLDSLTTARVMEAFGEGCEDMGLLFSAAAHLNACAMPIAEHASEDLKQRLLPGLCQGSLIGANAISESSAGSDLAALKTRATRDGDAYVISGEKSFVTNGAVADVFTVYAVTDPSAGYLGISALVVERNDRSVAGKPFDKLGLTTAQTGPVLFDELPRSGGQPARNGGTRAAHFQFLDGMGADVSVRRLSRPDAAAARHDDRVRDREKAVRQGDRAQPGGIASHRRHEGQARGRTHAPLPRVLDDRSRDACGPLHLDGQACDQRSRGHIGARLDPRARRAWRHDGERSSAGARGLGAVHDLLGDIGPAAQHHRAGARPMSLTQLLVIAARARPHKLAVEGPDGALSYAELDALSNRIARGLAALGVTTGDRVAIWHEKSVKVVATMQASLRLGAAYVPIIRRRRARARSRSPRTAPAPRS